MLEVEARLGRTLEEDFQEFYTEKGCGQKRIEKRWAVTRSAIFGRKKTNDLKCWVQVLQLPVRKGDQQSGLDKNRGKPSCEICGSSDVPLEGAHWIAASKGGNALASNIIKICPNCHTQLDISEDATTTSYAQAVLLTRVARMFTSSAMSFNRNNQLEFVKLCRNIIERR
jgi:5-methylcytosine-specific restriction endonuclease McrA